MLDTLHLAQEKLMDDNTSETGMFQGDPWQGLCCQTRGADLNPGHLALGHLPENSMVLNNSVLISAAVQEVENYLPFWMTTYNESSKELLSQHYIRAANSASPVRPSDLNFWSHLLHAGISIGRFSPASPPKNWGTERSWREPGFI